MKISEILKYKITYKSIIGKFHLEDSFSNKDYLIFLLDHFSFIIFKDKETKSINCYVHEINRFIEPYYLFLLFSTTLSKNDFKKAVDNLNKNKVKEYELNLPLDHKAAKQHLYSLIKPEKEIFFADLQQKIFTNKTEEFYKIALLQYRLSLEKEKVLNFICFKDFNYWYQFKTSGGMQIVPDNFNKNSKVINCIANPTLLNQFYNLEEINILGHQDGLNFSHLKLLNLDDKNIYLHINAHNSKDLFFALNSIISAYNFFINDFHIYLHENNSNIEITFHRGQKAMSTEFSNFYSKLQKNSIAKYFGINENLFSEYYYSNFSFDMQSFRNKNSNSSKIIFSNKKQLIHIFINDFIETFLKPHHVSIIYYNWNIEKKLFKLM